MLTTVYDGVVDVHNFPKAVVDVSLSVLTNATFLYVPEQKIGQGAGQHARYRRGVPFQGLGPS